MKKIIGILIVMTITLILLANISYGAESSLNIKMTPDTTNFENGIILVNISLEDFENITTTSPMGVDGYLDFEDSLFEEVTVAGKNGYSADYNNTTKKFAIDSNSSKDGDIIATFTFKLKDDVEIDENIDINAYEISVYNGTEIDYSDLELTATIIINNNEAVSNVGVTTGENNDQEEQNNDTEESQNQVAQSDNQTEQQESVAEEPKTEQPKTETPKIEKVTDLTVTPDKKIPQTGSTSTTVITLIVITMLAVGGFVRYKSIKLK